MQYSDYPALYQVADRTSLKGQQTYLRLVKVDLVLVIVAAALAATITLLKSPATSVFAIITALVLLGSIGAKTLNRYGRGGDQNWFDGRAVAESVKTITWRYMMEVEPFDNASTCDREFGEELRALLDARRDLQQDVGILSPQAEQITPRMRMIRALSLGERRDIYINNRLSDQAGWYRRKSQLNKTRATQWFLASFVAQAAALVIALIRIGIDLPEIDAVTFLVAVAAAFTAWAQIGRHDELRTSYALACQELLTIKSLASNVTTQEEFNNIVLDGEGAISREHTMWIAKRGEPLPIFTTMQS